MSKILAEIRSKVLDKYLSQKAISVFAALGLIYTLKKGFDALSTTANVLWTFAPKGTKNLLERYGKGSWALVTGATDGIGKEYVISFAKRGFNVVIVGRNADKLKQVSEFIKTTYHVETKTIQVDFVESTKADFFENIYKETEGLDISVIVNNVGLLLGGPLHLLDKKKIMDTNIVNLLPIVLLTRLYINDLLKRPHKSAIINLSSVAGKLVSAGFSIYSSGKAFDDYLSENMFLEYKDKIDVLSVRPHFVLTPMFAQAGGKPNLYSVTADQCAEGTLTWLGRGRYSTHGAKWHELIGGISENYQWIGRKILSSLESL